MSLTQMFLHVSQYLLQSIFPRTLVLIFILFFWDQDHERAFFDSADWALGKVSKSPPNPLLIHQVDQYTELKMRSVYARSIKQQIRGYSKTHASTSSALNLGCSCLL